MLVVDMRMKNFCIIKANLYDTLLKHKLLFLKFWY